MWLKGEIIILSFMRVFQILPHVFIVICCRFVVCRKCIKTIIPIFHMIQILYRFSSKPWTLIDEGIVSAKPLICTPTSFRFHRNILQQKQIWHSLKHSYFQITRFLPKVERLIFLKSGEKSEGQYLINPFTNTTQLQQPILNTSGQNVSKPLKVKV